MEATRFFFPNGFGTRETVTIALVAAFIASVFVDSVSGEKFNATYALAGTVIGFIVGSKISTTNGTNGTGSPDTNGESNAV